VGVKRMNSFEFTLHSPITDEEWDMITDVNFDHTDSITFQTKNGKKVKFVKEGHEIIRCRDCKYRKVNEHYGEKGYMNLKAICELDTGDIFQLGRYAEEDDWFCADAERREGDADAD